MIVCKECGQENMEGLEYCDGCGAKLEAEAPAESAPAPEAEAPVLSKVEGPALEMQAAETPVPEAEAAPAPTPQMVKVTITRGGTVGKEFMLQKGDNLVGRWDPDSGAFPEVDLEADDPEARISRKHALIRVGEQVTIEDIGSLNGTYVNRGPRLEPGVPVTLKDGDEIIVGKTFLKVIIA